MLADCSARAVHSSTCALLMVLHSCLSSSRRSRMGAMLLPISVLFLNVIKFYVCD